MIRKSTLVSVIVVVDSDTARSLHSIRESFARQDWPHKDLLIVNESFVETYDVRQVHPNLHEDPVAAGVRCSLGQVCVFWTPGMWYAPNVLSTHALLTRKFITLELRAAKEDQAHSRSFHRSSTSTCNTVKVLDSKGLIDYSDTVAAPKVWTFYHSGNIGDIIYAMPAIKALGQGGLIIGPEIRISPTPSVREPMSQKVVDNIAPLLLAQPYIKYVVFSERMPTVDFDLNQFRTVHRPGMNLACLTLEACGLDSALFDESEPWIKVDPITLDKSVVIQRSHRWQNPEFPWSAVVDKYRDQAVFVGTPEERVSFIAAFGHVPYLPTRTLLDLAKVVAGCHLYVGNQSCPYAIAEGLKVSTVQETSARLPNCLFNRPNVIYGRDKYTYTPDISSLPILPGRRHYITDKRVEAEYVPSLVPVHRGLVFAHSGDLGDIIYSLPAIKSLGGGDLVLYPTGHTREKMSPGKTEFLRSLLLNQSYIKNVRYSDSVPSCDYDLNAFRRWWTDTKYRESAIKWLNSIGIFEPYNLTLITCAAFKVSGVSPLDPWISVPPKIISPVVVSRTLRYRNLVFDWRKVYADYGKCSVFVGLKEEWECFVKDFGHIPYYSVKNAMEAASVIAGCDIFIGNQSFLYSLAEALKKRSIQETHNEDNRFNLVHPAHCKRNNAVHVIDSFPLMPKIGIYPSSSVSDASPVHKKLSVSGLLVGYTGYGQLTEEVYSSLLSNGIKFQSRPLCKNDAFGSNYPKRYDSLESSDAPDFELLISPPDCENIRCANTAQMTMWETTKLPQDRFDNLTRRRAILVPSEWGKNCLVSQGLRVPIYKVPLGIHPHVYFSRPRRKENGIRCIFGAAGRMQHGGVRKGLRDVIRVFLETFASVADVRLHIKCYPDCNISCSDPRVIVTQTHLSEDDLANWIAGIDCFVSLSKAEGWGLLQHQSLAIGRPLMSTLYGGVCEFFNPEFGYVVKHDEVVSDGFYSKTGYWAEPDFNDVKRKMLEVYNDVDSALSKGLLASKSVSNLTWNNMGIKLIEVLKEIGYV